MNLSARIEFLLSHAATLQKWVGPYDEAALRAWLDSELGHAERLEKWVDGSRVVARGPVLHVVSGNTPHAAFQSVFRAVLIGCENRVKIPSAGLPEFEAWADEVGFLDVRRELPEEWKTSEVAVVYGGEETIEFFREWISPTTRLIEHGPKLSAAFIFEQNPELFEKLAADILRYGQRGCLSIQMIYVQGDLEAFCQKLAGALAKFPEEAEASLSEAGAVRNERELARFRAANGAPIALWESQGSVEWTVILDRETIFLRPGPLSGFVRVCPMPAEISAHTLGPEVSYLSTAIVEPITQEARLEAISPPRICAPSEAQEPGIRWHPDGEMPLAGLVRWRDLG